jgi:hypothetical protein
MMSNTDICVKAIAELNEQIDKSDGVGINDLLEKRAYYKIALMEEAIAELRQIIAEEQAEKRAKERAGLVAQIHADLALWRKYRQCFVSLLEKPL